MLSEHLCEGMRKEVSLNTIPKIYFFVGQKLLNIQAAAANVNIWKIFTIATLYFVYS